MRSEKKISGESNNGLDGLLHPAAIIAFFAIAIIFTIVFLNPWFLTVSLISSSAFCFILNGLKAFRIVGGLIILGAVIAFINPLFNTAGSTALFTYMGLRPYTLEALCYGIAIGVMVMSVMLWFICFNAIVTSEKLTSVVGRIAPSTNMLTVMILQMIPNQRRRIKSISDARACIGKSVSSGSFKERISNGFSILEGALDPAFERAVETSDSMRSRGYGLKKRSSYALHRFGFRDAVACLVMAALCVGVIICTCFGGAEYTYTPSLHFVSSGVSFTVGITLFAVFMASPVIFAIADSIRWHSSMRVFRSLREQ